MNVTEKYGKTNTVANICKAHGVPLEHGFAIADAVIHSRYKATYWLIQAEKYLGKTTLTPNAFVKDLAELRDWMRDQWALAAK